MTEETLRDNFFWGLDFSTTAASIGWANEDGSSRGVVTAIWEKNLLGGSRLAAAYACVRESAVLLAREYPAVFGYVEQPSGVGRSLELVYMCGVMQAAMTDALQEHWGKPVEVRTVPSGTWKLSVLGRGDYGKPKKGDDFTYQAIIWCEEHGVDVVDDNEADGVCIAEHARLAVVFVPTS